MLPALIASSTIPSPGRATPGSMCTASSGRSPKVDYVWHSSPHVIIHTSISTRIGFHTHPFPCTLVSLGLNLPPGTNPAPHQSPLRFSHPPWSYLSQVIRVCDSGYTTARCSSAAGLPAWCSPPSSRPMTVGLRCKASLQYCQSGSLRWLHTCTDGDEGFNVFCLSRSAVNLTWLNVVHIFYTARWGVYIRAAWEILSLLFQYNFENRVSMSQISNQFVWIGYSSSTPQHTVVITTASQIV